MHPSRYGSADGGLSRRPVRLEVLPWVIFNDVLDNRQLVVFKFRVAQPEAKFEARRDVRRIEMAVIDEKAVAKAEMNALGSANT